MTPTSFTEAASVAKKKTNSERNNAQPAPTNPDFERLEFQAQIGFTADLDKARKKRGLSRSAYIRQAVLLLIQEDMGK